MTYTPPNSNGQADATGSAPVVLPARYIGGTPQTTPALNYEFLTNSTNGWFDALGYSWVSFTVVTNASLTAGTITFETTNDTAATTSQPALMMQDNTSLSLSRATLVNLTANNTKHYDAPVTGRYIRVRTSVACTGTGGTVAVNATLRQSGPAYGTTAATLGTAIPAGGNTIGSAALVSSGTASGAVYLGGTTTVDINSSIFTSTTTSSTISLVGGSGNAAAFGINVTGVSGTSPTLDVSIRESIGGAFFTLYTFERIIATGAYITPTLRLTGNALQYVCTVGGTTPAFTLSVTRLDKPSGGTPYRQFYDRSMTTIINSTTASYFVQGATQLFFSANTGGAGSGCTITIQGSHDNVQWYDTGIFATTPTGGGSVTGGGSTAPQFTGKWVRARVSASGAGQTMNYVCIKALGS